MLEEDTDVDVDKDPLLLLDETLVTIVRAVDVVILALVLALLGGSVEEVDIAVEVGVELEVGVG